MWLNQWGCSPNALGVGAAHIAGFNDVTQLYIVGMCTVRIIGFN